MYATKSNFRNCNYDVNETISWRMLSNDQSEEIFVTACEILERTGAEIESPEARRVLESNGCWTEGNIVHFPSAKLEWALRTVPSRLTLCDKDGKRAMLLETENVHFGPGCHAENMVDSSTGEPRKMTLSDVKSTARLAQQLANVEFVTYPGLPSDVNEKTAALHALEMLLSYTTKPIIFPVCCAKQAQAAIDMAALSVGGTEKLRRNPSFVLSVECAESRFHSSNATDIVMLAAKNNIPFIYQNNLVSGDTAPASTAGTLVLALANTLAAITLAQCVNAGTPVVAGGLFTIAGETENKHPFGASESALTGSGFANLCRYLKIPCAGTSGITDSARSDSQLGVEMAMGLLSTALSGTNILSGGGLLEGGRQFSNATLAISDEVMGVIYRIMKSFEVNEDKLACGVYDVVGPGGAYLGEEHTSVFFKSEQFWPNLITRKRIDDWIAEGSKSLGKRAEEYVDTILAEPESINIDNAAAEKIKAIVAQADAEF